MVGGSLTLSGAAGKAGQTEEEGEEKEREGSGPEENTWGRAEPVADRTGVEREVEAGDF